MTIDTRHYGYCSLGPLAPDAPATIADDYIQGSGGGVIMTKGTINLLGIHRPAPGSEIWLAYSDGQNWIARLPIKLRVLNSFADPLKRITTILVGCKFAYMENRKPPVNNLTEPEANSDVPEIDRRAYSQSIKASTVAEHILTTLGLTAAGPIPFTNSRIVDEWDLSSGFVQELARIAEAECFRCRLNENEQVEFINLNQEGGIGPLVNQFDIIDLTPQTVGELPADTVFARYERTQLKPPDNDADDPNDEDKRKKRNWELDESYGEEQYIHSYTDENGETKQQRGVVKTWTISKTNYDLKDRVMTRTEENGSLMGIRKSITTFGYPRICAVYDPTIPQSPPPPGDYTEVESETYEEYSPLGETASSCGFDGPIGSFRALGVAQSARRVTTYDKDKVSGITKTTTINKVPFISTPFGSDEISKQSQNNPYDRSDVNWLSYVTGVLNNASALVEYGSEVRIRTEREYGLQKRPGQQERNKSEDQKTPSLEQKGEIVWAVGSATSQTALELSPPYVSDDRIVKYGPGSYGVIYSDAPQKALNYARIENRLLLANRAGAGIQLLPIDTPPKPFDLFYVRLNGCTAAYRVNGRSWTISSDGIIVNVDGLFWGAIDGNINDAWFPLPPGISSLPATASVTVNPNPKPANAIPLPADFDPLDVDLEELFDSLPINSAPTFRKTLNPNIVIKPYQETVELMGGIRIGGGFEVQSWLPTEVEIGGGIKIGAGFNAGITFGTGLKIKPTAKLWTGLRIRDDLPVTTPETYQFTSVNYNSNGYLFDDDNIQLLIEDFSDFDENQIFTATYDPILKKFTLGLEGQLANDSTTITYILIYVGSGSAPYIKKATISQLDFAAWTTEFSAFYAPTGIALDSTVPTIEQNFSPNELDLTSDSGLLFYQNTRPSGNTDTFSPGTFLFTIEFY